MVRQSLPRATQADDVYNNFFIPKGKFSVLKGGTLVDDEFVQEH